VSGETYQIGRLKFHPDYHGRGIGTCLMAAIEGFAPEVGCNELFTGHASKGNLFLYQRLHYRTSRKTKIKPGLTLIYLE